MISKFSMNCRHRLTLCLGLAVLFVMALTACDDNSSIFTPSDSASVALKNNNINSNLPICNTERSSAIARNMIRIGFDWPAGATKINIYRDGTLVSATTETNLTSVIDTLGLREGQTYRYSCEAVIDAQFLMGSNKIDIYTVTTQAPTFSGIAYAASSGPHSISIAWQPVTETGVVASYFLIYAGLDNADFGFTNGFIKKKLYLGSYSTDITGLGDQLPYVVGVRACTINDICDGNVTVLHATTGDDPLSPTTSGATSVSLSNSSATVIAPWVEANGAVAKRLVYVRQSDTTGDFTLATPPSVDTFVLKQTFTVSDLTKPATSLVVDPLHNTFLQNYTYWLYVVDVDPSNNSNATAAKKAIVSTYTSDMTPPADPSGVTLAMGTPANSQIILSWNALPLQPADPNGVTRYEIYYTSAAGLGTPADPCSSSTRTKVDVVANALSAPPAYVAYPLNGLPERTSFRACIAAFDAAGNSSNLIPAGETVTTRDFTPPAPWYGIANITYNGLLSGIPSLKVAWQSSPATDIAMYKITLWKSKSAGVVVDPSSYVKIPVFISYASGVTDTIITNDAFSVTDYDEVTASVDACDNASTVGYNTINNCTTSSQTAVVLLPDTHAPVGFMGITSVSSNAQGQATVNWAWTGGLNDAQKGDYAGYLVYALAPGVAHPNIASLTLAGISPTVVHCPSSDDCLHNNVTSATITGLVPWKHYSFHVRAFDHSYTSNPLTANITEIALDNTSVLTTRVKDTDSPVFPVPTLQLGTDFIVKWAPASDNSTASAESDAIITYLVYRKAVSDFGSLSNPAVDGTLIQTTTKQSSNYNSATNLISYPDALASLTEATTYYYTVCAQDAALNPKTCIGYSKSQTVADNTPPTVLSFTGGAQPAPDVNGNFAWTIAWHAHDCIKNATQCGEPSSQDSTSASLLSVKIKRTITASQSSDYSQAVLLQGVSGHNSTLSQSTLTDETGLTSDPSQWLSSLKNNQMWVNYQITVTDGVGLATSSETHVWVDGVPPSVPSALSVLVPLGVSVSNINNPTIRVNVDGLVAGDKVKLYSDSLCSNLVGTSAAAGGPGSYLDVTVSPVLSVPSTYKFYATSQDQIGNTSKCSAISSAFATYTFNNVAPVVTGIADDLIPTQNKVWNWSCDKLAPVGPCTFRFVVDTNATWTASGAFGATATAGTTGNASDDGVSYYLHVQAIDIAGNTSAVTNVRALIDRQAPIAATITSQWAGSPLTQAHPTGGTTTMSFTASWNKSASAAGATGLYNQQIQFYQDSSNTACQGGKELGAIIDIGDNTSTTRFIQVTPYPTDTSYFSYKIVSLDQAGNSSASACSSALFVKLLPPTLTSLMPAWGPKSGGSVISINGTDFKSGATVLLGTVACTPVTYISPTQLTCTTGLSATAGQVAAKVTNPDGQFSTIANGFSYLSGMRVSRLEPSHQPNASSAGGFTCAVVNGGVQCWGDNQYGQLGLDPATPQVLTPRVVDSSVSSEVIDLAVGEHSACVTKNGGVRCWGLGTHGELGNGTNSSSFTPVITLADASGAAVSKSLSAFGSVFCALVDGSVKCWGDNGVGKFAASTPTAVTGLDTGSVSDVAVGYRHICAVKLGAVYCLGGNNSGELGVGSTIDNMTPTVIPSLNANVTAIAAGDSRTCAIQNNALYCWGQGFGTSPVAIAAPLNAGVTSVSIGQYAVCAITNGNMYCWGANTNGTVGNGNTNPVASAGSSQITGGANSVSIGRLTSCALVNGAPWCWGANASGDVGTGSAGSTQYAPAQVAGMFGGLQELSKGNDVSTMCAVASGKVYCWGAYASNTYIYAGQNSPVAIAGIAGASKVTVGSANACAIVNGSVYCWGANGNGQLGLGVTDASMHGAALVPGLSNVTDIMILGYTVCVAVNGGVKCWGDKYYIPSSVNGGANVLTPVDIPGLGAGSGVRQLGVWENNYYMFYMSALKNGEVWNWYSGTNPIKVFTSGPTTGWSTATGGYYSIRDGALYGSWGNNAGLIDATLWASGVSDIVAGDIYAGLSFNCGLKNGYPFCFGKDPGYGSLGDGLISPHSATVQVVAPASAGGADMIARGYGFACVAEGMNIYCWGVGNNGSLGNGSSVNSGTPVLVKPFP